MTNVQPKDDSLRLVLSADQDSWIRGHIRDSQRYLILMCVLFVVSLLCIIILNEGLSQSRVSYDCVRISNLDPSLIVNGKVDGLRVCGSDEIAEMAQQAEAREDHWAKRYIWLLFFAYPLALGSPIGVFVNLFNLFKFRGYLKDHDAFLRAYNR